MKLKEHAALDVPKFLIDVMGVFKDAILLIRILVSVYFIDVIIIVRILKSALIIILIFIIDTL